MQLARFSRIVIVGSSGSGKTTLARRIAETFDLPYLELDSIHWGPNWTLRPEFLDHVRAVAATDRWVIEGNYRAARDIIWPRAEALVWLNLPMLVSLWYGVARSVRRIRSQQPVHGGNRESLARTLLHPNGIPWWIIQSHARRRREYRRIFDAGTYSQLQVFEIRSRREIGTLLGP